MTPIYHIVHLDRLASMVADGFIYADGEARRLGCTGTTIGMSHVKARRLSKPVPCHEGLFVGGCVPFYFCPRSVMLYILHRGNHPDVSYHGGERPILHLEFAAEAVRRWADAQGLRTAFTDRNASSATAEFGSDMAGLAALDWAAINATDWRNCIERKQAEFLVEARVPFSLVSRIGVLDGGVRGEVMEALSRAGATGVCVEAVPEWYY